MTAARRMWIAVVVVAGMTLVLVAMTLFALATFAYHPVPDSRLWTLPHDRPLVRVTVTGVDLGRRTAFADVRVYMSPDFLVGIRDAHGKPVFRRADSRAVVVDAHRHDAVDIEISDRYGSGDGDFGGSTPRGSDPGTDWSGEANFGELSAEPFPVAETSISFNLTGDPAQFPIDKYVAEVIADFSWDWDLSVPAAGSPPALRVDAGERLGDYDAKSDSAAGFVISRTRRYQTFVTVVAIAPLLLGVVAAAESLWRRRRSDGPRMSFELAAGLLAVLPLRAILVPSSISELTLLDYGLAVEVTFFVVVACISVVLASTSPARQHS